MNNIEKRLIDLEEHFGGYHTGVSRNKISPKIPTDAKLHPAGMTGGDRMSRSRHGYAKYYAKHLSRFVDDNKKPYTILECGILRGTGLAIWSTLFPNATIIGLDIDLSHTKNNLDFLKSKGAFENNNLELYEFDQFADNTLYIKEILKDRKIDIAIDDGFHSDFTILNTLDCLTPHLSSNFCYFIEDNRTISSIISKIYKEKYKISSYKKFVVQENYER